MSRSTPPNPQHDGDPAQTGAAPTHDLVPGDPPVPITVWRTARGDDDPTAMPGRLAARLVAAYSRPGEVVVDLTDDHALDDACRRGNRRYHKAWFTDAGAVIIGPATFPPPAEAGSQMEADFDEAEPPELSDWFGDDLTDPHLPPPGPPVAQWLIHDGVHSATTLMVAGWPLHTLGGAANRVRLAWLLDACKHLLRPGGCLVLVVATPAGTPATPEDFRPLVAAASAAGLGYLQHIVAVAADTDGDQFTYFATDEELGKARQWAVTHLRVHADAFVFTHKPLRVRPAGGARA